MTTARRVTEAEALGEATSAADQDSLTRRYTPDTYFDARIEKGIFDRIRVEAREASYRNSDDEARTIAAVEKAIYDRVQDHERVLLGQADRTLDMEEPRSGNAPAQSAIARAQNHMSALSDIRRELADRDSAVSTAELADRFERIRAAIANRDGHSLVVVAKNARTLRGRLADPYSSVQDRVLPLMPRTAWRPLGIRHW